ncbi:MAG: hypothetical protein E7311_03060 [Clostridiales bacterium]|nr:hypothetical protein [Clostridiales bacterium]
MGNILKVSCLIIATIIGAGFSSGREIYTFFNIYKDNIVFILISTFLVFYFTIYYTLKLSYKSKIYNYNQLTNKLFGKRINKVVDKILNIFLLIIFSIMVAGFGEFMYTVLGIPKIWGSLVLLIICFITLLNNIEGIMKVSVFIVPIIILSIIGLFIFEVNSNNILIKENIEAINFFSGIIYASYNLVIAIPVIVSSSKIIENVREIKYISLISSSILLVLIILIYLILEEYMYIIKNISMPLLYIARLVNNSMYILYLIVIAISIYSTAVSTQYSLVQKYNKERYILAILATGILSLIISFISFNKLIDICFPIIGWIGIIQTFYIIYIQKKK